MSRFSYSFIRSLKVYIEVLIGFSLVFYLWGRNNILFFEGYVFEGFLRGESG